MLKAIALNLMGLNINIELAIAGNAEILVTHNIKDFSRAQLKFPRLQIKQPQEII